MTQKHSAFGFRRQQPAPEPEPAPQEADLLDAAYDDDTISHVIRPAAIVPEEAASAILIELSLNSVTSGGLWVGEPSRWRRYDRPWLNGSDAAGSELMGSIQVAYGTPTRYEITIYRVTITRLGSEQGWSVDSLTDDALSFGGLTLNQCPRARLASPPPPFRF